MKKIKLVISGIIVTILVLLTLGASQKVMANCDYSGNGDVLSALDGCLGSVDGLVGAGSDTDVGSNIDSFKQKIIGWNTTLAGFFGLLAVGALIYGAFQLVFSTGDDEKVNSAKKTIKWALLGFIAILLAAGIVRIVISIIYNYAG